MINKLKKQQAKYINDEEKELMSLFSVDSSYIKQIVSMQEDVIFKAMLFALQNKTRAARLLVIKGMMSVEDYLACKY